MIAVVINSICVVVSAGPSFIAFVLLPFTVDVEDLELVGLDPLLVAELDVVEIVGGLLLVKVVVVVECLVESLLVVVLEIDGTCRGSL